MNYVLVVAVRNINNVVALMLENFEIKKLFNEICNKQVKLVAKLNVDSLNNELGELTNKVNSPNFWNDQQTAAATVKKQQSIEKTLSVIAKVSETIEEFELVLEMHELGDLDLEEVNSEYEILDSLFKEFEIECLLSGEYDDNNAIIDIHPGAGGTESQDWAQMLYDMYMKYLKKNNYKVEIIDLQMGDVAGIKSVTFEVSGDKAYGKLKGENGIHRLVRISPFDSAAKRHTSFSAIKVMPVIENDNQVDINPSDLKIDVYRSGGAGGQSVNTTDSAVRITHIPTNTIVTCQNERSQLQNKEQAMKVLRSRLMELKLQQQAEETAKLAGVQLSNGWGSQKRSYVLHPYKMVKDHHVNFESSQAEKVLAGDLEDFLYHNLLNDNN